MVDKQVADIDFQPEKRTVEDLFVGAEYYVIPRFQRPYSWDRANLDDFWRDVVYDNDVGYFIGPMVAWRDPASSIRRLVDGQQRLTTIAIMFAALRDEFQNHSEQKLAKGVQRYLEKRNRDNELEFTLQTEAEARYLNQAIFKESPDTTAEPGSEEERALERALRQIRDLVTSETKKRNQPVKWLTDVRDRLLGLRVIWIEHGNEDDAYTIFETLNSRGKDLEVVDLLKNHLFSKLRSSGNAPADVIRSQWNDMRVVLEPDGAVDRIDVNRFILHWWISQEDYVAQRKLFKAIKEKVGSKAAAQRRLDSLGNDAPLYRAALEPGSRKWPMEEEAAKRSLQALVDFRVVQPGPLLLSLLRARSATPKLKAAQFRTALQTIERFHFQYTVVSQLSSSGGVSEMYAKAARELSSAKSAAERSAALDDIRSKLVARKPERELFVEAFTTRFIFTNVLTRESKLVRYVLAEILRFLNPATSQESLTIEHILSQEKLGSGASDQDVGSIGNLILVSQTLNTKLGNKEFKVKKQLLGSDAGKPYDIGGVLDQDAWGTREIRTRAKLLGELAYDKVWRLPA